MIEAGVYFQKMILAMEGGRHGGGQRRAAPPNTDQREEHARFMVMQTIKGAAYLHSVVFQLRYEEVCWQDILAHIQTLLQ
jgi:hypothetical protein